jgi:heme exporter protein C
MFRKPWWKILSFVLLVYTCVAGFLITVPEPAGVPLQQTIRNLFFHVPMWFGMMVLFSVSAIYSIKYLSNPSLINDTNSFEFARTGTVLGLLGFTTGMIWANYQWGKPISGDPKQIGAAIAVLIYMAYFVLRGNIVDEKKARISAVYNIFAFCMLFPTIWIMPRLVESLHPGGMGSEGNPGLNPKDSNISMKLVFWPAVIGWSLLATWITTLRIRVKLIEERETIVGSLFNQEK